MTTAEEVDTRLLICAKSTWNPALRREHALAKASAARGVKIDFVEQPTDVRAIRSDPMWLWRRATTSTSTTPSNASVTVTTRRTLVPGHRGGAFAALDAAGLRRAVHRVARTGPLPQAVVVSAPWNWLATTGLPRGVRRIFDLTDDWRTMLSGPAARVEQWYRRIEQEADEIIVVAEGLSSLFDRPVVVVPNAAGDELHAAAPTRRPGRQNMTYVGTLSERFDTDLMSDVLSKLPTWSLDLYGPALYQSGDASRLTELIERTQGRARWHGVVPREHLAAAIDAADIAIIPNLPAISVGQDSMKLYDYAARGRPIVASGLPAAGDRPPVFENATGATAFVAAVEAMVGLDGEANRTWSGAHTWHARSDQWLCAVLGREMQPRRETGGSACAS